MIQRAKEDRLKAVHTEDLMDKCVEAATVLGNVQLIASRIELTKAFGKLVTI